MLLFCGGDICCPHLCIIYSQARFSRVLMSMALADRKRCFLPWLTASCVPHRILFQVNVPFYTRHSTGSHRHSVVKQYIPHFNQHLWGVRIFSVLYFYFISYWCIVYLQCCVSFRDTAKLYIYLYLFFVRFFSHTGYQRTLSRDLCAIQ